MPLEKKLTSNEVAFYCTQFAIILNSGLSLHDGVESIKDDCTNPREKKVIQSISKVLNDEKPLYMALESTNAFPHYAVSMVKVGELTGRLEEVLKGLAEYYDNENILKEAVKHAIVQPLVLMGMMFAVVLVMIGKVLPVFTDIFKQFDPEVMNSLNSVVDKTKTIALIVLGIIGAAIVIMLITLALMKNRRIKSFLENVFSHFVLTKSILELYSLERFSRAMCLMVKSGIDATEAIDYALEINTNPHFEAKLENVKELMENGQSLTEALGEVRIYKGMTIQILKVAYKSGAYEDAWDVICEKYTKRLSEKLENMVTVIEPVFVGILTVIIGIILVSVMLPLVSVMGHVI